MMTGTSARMMASPIEPWNMLSICFCASKCVLPGAQGLKFAAYLYAWDATKPGLKGPQLYASDPRSLSTPRGEVVTFNVPGCLTLTGNTEYVAFLSTAGFWPGGSPKVTYIDTSSTTLAGSSRIYSLTASNSTATFQTTDAWGSAPPPPSGKNIALSVTYY